MTHQYSVKGMTCGGCESNVKKALEAVPGVTKVEVKRDFPQATITMEKHIETAELQKAINQYGFFQISDAVAH